nr:MAG TPA: hypothetical protein [Bacteriophage sp.]
MRPDTLSRRSFSSTQKASDTYLHRLSTFFYCKYFRNMIYFQLQNYHI